MLSVLALSLYGPRAASHRVRLSQYQSGFKSYGINLQIHSLLDDDYLARSFSGAPPLPHRLIQAYVGRIKTLLNATTYDLLIIYCELLPFVPYNLETLLVKTPFIYDFDDAFYLKYSQRSAILSPFLGNKIQSFIANAVSVTAGNAVLANYASMHNPNVTILPSVVDTDNVYRPAPSTRVRNNSVFTVGWIGSPSTSPYLSQIGEALSLLARERHVRLVVIGGAPPDIPSLEIVYKNWSLDHEVSMIQEFDVGVMPLPDNPWTRGKCAYKLIQCMACGVPVVASPVGANVVVVPPDCGFLASTTSEWLSSLRTFASNRSLREDMGTNARNHVVAKYSLKRALPIYSQVITTAHASTNTQS